MNKSRATHKLLATQCHAMQKIPARRHSLQVTKFCRKVNWTSKNLTKTGYQYNLVEEILLINQLIMIFSPLCKNYKTRPVHYFESKDHVSATHPSPHLMKLTDCPEEVDNRLISFDYTTLGNSFISAYVFLLYNHIQLSLYTQ